MSMDAIPDSECFLESYMITVIVEDTKFRLDSHFLERESETLKNMITASKADSIRLEDATVAEFRAIWRYFYEGMYDDYKPSTAEWMDLLSIANTYGFTKVYRRAVHEIDDLEGTIDPVERILLAKRLKVNRWLAPAYAALCLRTDPITASEAEKLGMYTFVALVAARESFYRESPTKVAAPIPDRYGYGYGYGITPHKDGSQRCGDVVVPVPTVVKSPQERALATVNRVFGLEGEAVETPLCGKDEPPKEDAKAGGGKKKKLKKSEPETK